MLDDDRSGFQWPVSKISRVFGLDRRTVTRRLDAAGVAPRHIRAGAKLYDLADIGTAVFGQEPLPGASPDQMDPKSRKDWFQSENERVKLECDQGKLVVDHEVARRYAVVVKGVANWLDSLPDQLERDHGISADALERIERTIDGLRERMYTDATE